MNINDEGTTPAYVIGDSVEKYTGDAQYAGTVVAVYYTLRKKLRYVIEVWPQGFQMIVNEAPAAPPEGWARITAMTRWKKPRTPPLQLTLPDEDDWRRVVFADECSEFEQCPLCETDYAECGCPGPTMDEHEYEVRDGVLYARSIG